MNLKSKLACQFGTIDGFFPYPGKADINNEEEVISLREAARLSSVHKMEVTFCKCKALFKSKKCPCKKKNVTCDSSNCSTIYCDIPVQLIIGYCYSKSVQIYIRNFLTRFWIKTFTI